MTVCLTVVGGSKPLGSATFLPHIGIIMAHNYQLTFYLKGSRTIYRKANHKDAVVLTSDWNIEMGTRFLSINFEHPESAPLVINLDQLEYIDFRPL